jgi:hypothetical protein
MRLLQCIRGLRALPMMIASTGRSAGWIPGPGDNCGGPPELTRADPVCDRPVTTQTRPRFPRAAGVLAEKWYAWCATHEFLQWYQRVGGANPQLTGTQLYQEIIVRRFGLDLEVARCVLQRVRQSFCEWPRRRELRFRDVVNYLVMDEYMHAHSTEVGTYTDMRRMVSSIIPSDL